MRRRPLAEGRAAAKVNRSRRRPGRLAGTPRPGRRTLTCRATTATVRAGRDRPDVYPERATGSHTVHGHHGVAPPWHRRDCDGGARIGRRPSGGRSRQFAPPRRARWGGARSATPLRRRATPTKDCAVCGRVVTWANWARDRDQVRYSFHGVPTPGLSPGTPALRRRCSRCFRPRRCHRLPSEAAQAVSGEDWRPLMEPPGPPPASRLRRAGGDHPGGRVVDRPRPRADPRAPGAYPTTAADVGGP